MQRRRCGFQTRQVPVEYADPNRVEELDNYIPESVRQGSAGEASGPDMSLRACHGPSPPQRVTPAAPQPESGSGASRLAGWALPSGTVAAIDAKRESERAGHHQNHAEGVRVDAEDLSGKREGEDRPHGDQRKAETHIAKLPRDGSSIGRKGRPPRFEPARIAYMSAKRRFGSTIRPMRSTPSCRRLPLRVARSSTPLRWHAYTDGCRRTRQVTDNTPESPTCRVAGQRHARPTDSTGTYTACGISFDLSVSHLCGGGVSVISLIWRWAHPGCRGDAGVAQHRGSVRGCGWGRSVDDRGGG